MMSDAGRRGAYANGWSDGYAEGYGCKLSDATEPFNPVALARLHAVMVIARHLQKQRPKDFTDDSEAIGLARGIVAALASPDTKGNPHQS